MSGIHGQVLGHLAKRGVDYVSDIRKGAHAYDTAGAEMEVQPWEFLPVFITGLLTLLVVAGIKYTIGEVMSSLAMIESRTTTAIVDDKPPAYADEPDAPLEKEPLMPAEAEADKADVEVTLINNKPITSSIRATAKHLDSVGGFRSRFRGLGVSIIYHFVHSTAANFLSAMLGMGLIGNMAVYVLVSVGLARLHMAWTHAMIAAPVATPFWRHMVPRKQCKAILLPSLVFALAQQATFILPVFVAFALGLPEINQQHVVDAAHKMECHKLAFMGLRFLAVPATLIFVALAILLPATVTLTRIEALLLPEDKETIVPFDRQALIGNIDITARGSSRALFVQAWRSFDSSSRWRLIKLYFKGAMIQVSVIFIAAHIMLAELYLIGGERLADLMKGVTAQIKLGAMEVEQN